MRINTKELATLEHQPCMNLSTSQLIDVLLARYMLTNGFEFVTPTQKANLIEILNEPATGKLGIEF